MEIIQRVVQLVSYTWYEFQSLNEYALVCLASSRFRACYSVIVLYYTTNKCCSAINIQEPNYYDTC